VKEKGGVFSLLVGAMAIAVMALVVFSGQAAINEEESESFVEIMGDTRAAYQNVVLVFNAAVQEANTAPGTTRDQLNNNYLTPAIDAMNTGFGPVIQCIHTTNSFAGGTADITILCESIVENSIETRFSASFEKRVVFS